MKDYFVNLVKSDVKATKDFSFVRNYNSKDSYLIYNTEQADPYMIFFEDYTFKVCSYDGCDGVIKVTPIALFDCLWDAIYYIREHNS